MTLEFEGGNAVAASLVVLLLVLLALGLMGEQVTPVTGGEPQWLTPVRWTSFKLQKTVRQETEKLVRDAERLQRLLENEQPDPVAAMLLAQDVYATHQNGSAATAAARGALIAAAEAAVRAALGETPGDEAIASYNAALSRIAALSATLSAPPDPTPSPSLLYLPAIQAP